ncbi:hypothetical protein SELMODRAFT_231250 [Selaginella moellendorffii]|uniref:Aminopeptidase n=1 Tax=Selaginella moellendorffii TaxID=88036 RepID=D8RD01_SELML|nr:hypothetical protein SELMODRAFT_231250 [Selaginella moellendorffii]
MEAGKDVIRLEREPFIVTMKPKLIIGLADSLEQKADQADFLLLCKRVEAFIRAWYHVQFEELMQLYALFDPANGGKKLEKQNLSAARVDELEQRFLDIYAMLMEKSNFKVLSDNEFRVATSGHYLLNLPIAVDKNKLDSKLLGKFFEKRKDLEMPTYTNQYVMYRRGIGLDKSTDAFISAKLDELISRAWDWILGLLRKPISISRLRKLLGREQNRAQPGPADGSSALSNTEHYVERIRIQNMKITFGNFLKKTTIQEPTFERLILLYRLATPRHDTSPYGNRGICIKQFKHVPMADVELVLPEKKNPSLTAMDWVKFLLSAIIGFVAFSGTLEAHPSDIWVALAILGGFLSYCAKIYFTFHANMMEYQRLITNSMYDKQLDSGRGTLLHLCDDVIQQEVKEVILAYYVLMTKGKHTIQTLDELCEEVLLEEFDEKCNFEVEDALKKLERLGIVSKDSLGRYAPHPLKRANEIIGITTDEVVARISSA